jgi:hypothetical protein
MLADDENGLIAADSARCTALGSYNGDERRLLVDDERKRRLW